MYGSSGYPVDAHWDSRKGKELYVSARVRGVILDLDLWLKMWRDGRSLRENAASAEINAILERLPAYLVEIRRVYDRLPGFAAAREAREKQLASTGRANPPPLAPHTPECPLEDNRNGEGDEGDRAEERERSITLHVNSIKYSDAKKLRGAITGRPGVRAVQMDYDRTSLRTAKYSVRTTLTVEALVGILTNGVQGMAFSIIATNPATIEVSMKW